MTSPAAPKSHTPKSHAPDPPPWIARREVSPLERMPRLAVLMADAAQAWAESFAELSTTPVEMNSDRIETCRIESLSAHATAGRTVAIVEAEEWGAELAFMFDRDFVALMVEALFGGEGGEAPFDPAQPLSPLERQIGELMVRRVVEAMTVGFATHLPTTFRFDRVLLKPDLGGFAKPGTMLLQVRLGIRALERSAGLVVLIPQTALEPFADRLGETEEAAVPAVDPRWSRRLEAEVGRAMATLQASVAIPDLDLGTLARLAPGHILRLPLGAGSAVTLACGDDNLFRCELGQSAGHYTLRIDERLGAVEPRNSRSAPPSPGCP